MATKPNKMAADKIDHAQNAGKVRKKGAKLEKGAKKLKIAKTERNLDRKKEKLRKAEQNDEEELTLGKEFLI